MTHKEEYDRLLKSGLFWEFFPEYTGDWEKDEKSFSNFKEHQETAKAIKQIGTCIVNFTSRTIDDFQNNDKREVETPIAKVRNLMSPIYNYFEMMKLEDKFDHDLKEFKEEELKNCFEVLPKLIELIKDDKNWQ